VPDPHEPAESEILSSVFQERKVCSRNSWSSPICASRTERDHRRATRRSATELGDARFFFDQDRKVRLETRVPHLGNVVYHNKLGSQLERVERVQLLAGQIGS